jgi:hypothetical protein
MQCIRLWGGTPWAVLYSRLRASRNQAFEILQFSGDRRGNFDFLKQSRALRVIWWQCPPARTELSYAALCQFEPALDFA